ncbi:MAG: glycosyltransferase [Solirubrobacteraceae bacterium]
MRPAAPPNRSKERVRVVTLVDYATRYGGAEHLALSIATHLDPERFESTLCSSRWPMRESLQASAPETLEQLSANGVRLLPLGRSGKADVWVWGRLFSFLRRHRIDVLHAHKFGSNVWGAMVGRTAGVPVVLAHEHSWSYQGQPMRRIIDREIISRRADRLIAVSREDQRRMVAVEGIAQERTLFVPNGISRAEPTAGHDVRAELGIAPTVPVIGSIGSLLPVKSFDVLFRAVAILVQRRPDVQVLIAGEGPERNALEALIQELGLDGTVHLLGRRPDVPDILQALDVAVCCSDSEGSPLSVMEYMQAGLAVAATTVGGVPDLIEPGVHGLLVPPRDPPALAAALTELLEDPERARAMGDRGRERQRAEFDIDVLVHRLEALYLELLEAHRDRSASPTR